MQAIGVFLGVDQLESAALVKPFRQWQLNDVAGAVWIRILCGDGFVHLRLGRIGWKIGAH